MNIVCEHIKSNSPGIVEVQINIRLNPETREIEAWEDRYARTKEGFSLNWITYSFTEYTEK